MERLAGTALSRARDHVRTGVLAVLNLSLVLWFTGNPLVCLFFFGVSFIAVRVATAVPTRWLGMYRGLTTCVLTIVLLVVRKTPYLFDAAKGTSRFDFLTPLAVLDLSFLGVSYCWLRAVAALMDDRVWKFEPFFRYWFFFPTFASGPIMSPQEFLDQKINMSWSDRREGLARILEGILKTTGALLLGLLVPLSNRWAANWAMDRWPSGLLWLGMFLSGVWLYLNFAGYSDIYIGLARMLGIRAPENFDRPYFASDLAAFWQRWHISLGNWLRSFVYAPLSLRLLDGTPTRAFVASAIAPVVTMAICGAWHMLSAGYLLWGLMHGVGLALQAVWTRLGAPRLPAGLRNHPAYACGSWVLTHSFVTMSWVFFLPTDYLPMEKRLRLFGQLFGVTQ
jgi:D-alanyl-lipoteichoic acid acyltransferase DltB (MBOAT superfamily)